MKLSIRNSRARRAIAATVTLCLTGLGVGACASAPAPEKVAATTTPSNCERLDVATELTMHSYHTGPNDGIPLTKVGHGLIFYDNVFNSRNEVVGHVVGMTSGVYQRGSDDHLIVTYNADYDVPGGTFRLEAITDRNGIFAGEPQEFRGIGTSGRYLDKVILLKWKLLEIPPKDDTRVSLDVMACG
jgi:hypothetical protein